MSPKSKTDLDKYKENKAELLSDFFITADKLPNKFWAASSEIEVDRICRDLFDEFV